MPCCKINKTNWILPKALLNLHILPSSWKQAKVNNLKFWWSFCLLQCCCNNKIWNKLYKFRKDSKRLRNKKSAEEWGEAVSRESNYHLRVGKWWNISVTWVRVSVNNMWKNHQRKTNETRKGKVSFKKWHKSFVLFLIKYKNVFAILCKSWDLEMTDRKQKWETKDREIEICECWDYTKHYTASWKTW